MRFGGKFHKNAPVGPKIQTKRFFCIFELNKHSKLADPTTGVRFRVHAGPPCSLQRPKAIFFYWDSGVLSTKGASDSTNTNTPNSASHPHPPTHQSALHTRARPCLLSRH